MTTFLANSPAAHASDRLAHGWRRWVAVAVTGAICLAVAVAVLFLLLQREQRELEASLREKTLNCVDEASLILERYLEPAVTLRGLFENSRRVERKDFRQFAALLRKQMRHIDGLFWVRRVPLADRESYLNEVRRDDRADFALRAWPGPKAEKSAAMLFPVEFAEPEDSASWVGYDLSGQASLATAFAEAEQRKDITVSSVFASPEGNSVQRLIATVVPLDFSSQANSEKETSWNGFLVVVIRVQAILSESENRFLAPSDEPSSRMQVRLALFDTTDSEATEIYDSELEQSHAFDQGERATEDALNWAVTYDRKLANRQFSYRAKLAKGHFESGHDVRPWAWFVVALALGILLTAYVAGLVNQAEQVRAMVDSSTARLRDANAELQRHAEELAKADATIRDNSLRMQSLLDNTSAVIYLKDQSGQYLLINRQFERLFRVTNEQVKGKTDYDLFPREMADAFRVNDRRVAESGEAYECEEVAPHEDGPHTYISIKFPIRDEKGKLTAVAGISTDITQRKRDADALLQSEHQLQERAAAMHRINSELQQFSYAVSHDLQEPLRSVTGFCQLLQRRYQGKLDEQADMFVRLAVEGALRMKILIDDLLTFSRVGTHGRDFAAVDMNQVLAVARENLRASIEETDAQITSDVLPRVHGDESQLEQLLQNLIGNSLKFRAPEVRPKVHLAVEKAEANWKFSVSDNGIGIAPEYRDRVFVIFQRLHTRAEYPGTGVGLAVCKRIVERHGGCIWVGATEETGSCFYFTLPPAEDATR